MTSWEEHVRMYNEVHAGSPRAMHQASEAWLRMSELYRGLESDLKKELTKSRDFWSGEAGDGFRRRLSEVADNARERSEQAGKTRQALTAAADALEAARQTMPKPIEGGPTAYYQAGQLLDVFEMDDDRFETGAKEAQRVYEQVQNAYRASTPRIEVPTEGNGLQTEFAAPTVAVPSGEHRAAGQSGTGPDHSRGGQTTADSGNSPETSTDLTGVAAPPAPTGPVSPGPGPAQPGPATGGPLPGLLPPALGGGPTGSGGKAGGGSTGPIGRGRVGGPFGADGIVGGRPGTAGGAGSRPAIGSMAGRGGIYGGRPLAGVRGGLPGAIGPDGGVLGGRTGANGEPEEDDRRAPRPAWLVADAEDWDVQKKAAPSVIEE